MLQKPIDRRTSWRGINGTIHEPYGPKVLYGSGPNRRKSVLWDNRPAFQVKINKTKKEKAHA